MLQDARKIFFLHIVMYLLTKMFIFDSFPHIYKNHQGLIKVSKTSPNEIEV